MAPTKLSESKVTKPSSLIKPNIKSERLELATAISNITLSQEKFVKAVELLANFKSESLTNLDLEINTKKIELETLAEEYNRSIKENQIKIDLYLAWKVELNFNWVKIIRDFKIFKK